MITELLPAGAKVKDRFEIVAPLQWRQIDGLWVVFRCDPPGICELDAFAAAVVMVAEDGPATAEEAAQRLAVLTDADCTDVLVRETLHSLRWLATVGLVEPAA